MTSFFTKTANCWGVDNNVKGNQQQPNCLDSKNRLSFTASELNAVLVRSASCEIGRSAPNQKFLELNVFEVMQALGQLLND